MDTPRPSRVVNGYSTDGAMVLAHDVFWDGNNFRCRGLNTWLLRTQRGNYFAIHGTLLSEDEAVALYESLPEHEVEWSEAFPNRMRDEA